jgi:hypothetical protein
LTRAFCVSLLNDPTAGAAGPIGHLQRPAGVGRHGAERLPERSSGANSMRKLGLILVLAATACCGARPAFALLQFYRVFEQEYIVDHEDKDFAKYVKSTKVRCLVCHQGKKRTNHNPYGVHLVKLLDKKKHIRDPDAVRAALAKVANMRSDPKDEKSPTYLELITASKLPGGELEELMKEPEEVEKTQ